MTVEVVQFPCLADNYGYLLHDAESGLTATVDTPDVAAIETALSARGWTLTHIFNTHHHWDHAGGNQELKARHRCQIIGPRADRDRIPGIDVEVGEGDTFRFGTTDVEVYDTPGHTRGHIVFRIPEQNLAFVGDTLFAMGCGRLFEGTAEQMWSSLQKILAWPDETILYCAHEYTESNGEFAVTVRSGQFGSATAPALGPRATCSGSPHGSYHPCRGTSDQPVSEAPRTGHPTPGWHGGGFGGRRVG